MTLPDRFWAKVTEEAETGCLVWTGAVSSSGYGSWRPGGRAIPAQSTHVSAWVDQHGPVPEGMTLDHTCRNRRCCLVAHLEVTTRGDNVLRGEGPTAQNARKTHCPSGHPYDSENTRMYRGWRYCKTCTRIHARSRQTDKELADA